MVLSKKQLEQLTGFTVTIISSGLASFVGMIYLTDWKPIATFIPYYNGKFKDDKKPE